MQKKSTKKFGLLLLLLLLVALALSGCSDRPDSTTEDPLAAFDVDAMLPFATTAPELTEATPTPIPTPEWESEPTVAPLDWQNEPLPGQDNTDDDAQPTSAPGSVVNPPATETTYRDLRKGDESNAVKSLQQRLTELGYYTGNVNGRYGDETVKAVKRYQHAVGLSQTGVATSALQQSLYAGNAPRYQPTPQPTKVPSSTPKPEYFTLERSNSGPEVWNLQTRLQALGYYSGYVDGLYGAATEKSIKLFQRAIGYEQTGVATESLQKRLYASDAPKYVAPTATPRPTARSTAKPTAKPNVTPAPSGDYVELKHGSTGERVKNLQRRLKELGYFDGDIGGNYLDKTEAAVKKFQKAIGEKATGVATVNLQKKLFSSRAFDYAISSTPVPSATEDPSGYKELSQGASGERVKRLQQRLKDLGYYNGAVDGDYGEGTVVAVRRFERAYGRDETGVATVALQKNLFSDDARHNTESNPTSKPEEEYVKLSYGSTGDRVKTLQRRLKELGYFDGDIGGNYLEKTEAAVKRFQKAIGEDQSGVATVDLQKKIFSSKAPSYSGSSEKPSDDSYTPLSKGDSGSKVENLQYRLKDLGYYTGAVDGDYGDSTVKAIKLFERAYGKDETGKATSALQKQLFSEKAKPYAGDSSSSSSLKKGSTGQDVYKLQNRLIELGYLDDGGAEEATFDEATHDAVVEAQKASKYKKTDGVATKEWLKYLYSDEAYEISRYEYGG